MRVFWVGPGAEAESWSRWGDDATMGMAGAGARRRSGREALRADPTIRWVLQLPAHGKEQQQVFWALAALTGGSVGRYPCNLTSP